MTERQVIDIKAREVLDCRGLPTVHVDLCLEGGFRGRADVPSGRSTGHHEAFELRDGGTRFGGFGVMKAVANVHDEIAPAVTGAGAVSQQELDHLLLAVDGTADKSRLGANALLGVSMAFARAQAAAVDLPLYKYLNPNAYILPVPQFNLINGGKHASNDLDFQEFSIVPTGARSILEALQIATEVNLVLAEILIAKYDKYAINTGDEGGYVPPCTEPAEALSLLHDAVDKAGCSAGMEYALDCAATHLYDSKSETYLVAGRRYDAAGMGDLYERLVRDFDVTSIEDPLEEDSFEETAALTSRLNIQIVGDDLFTTNVERLRSGIEIGAANALLWKMNQIGTLSEALDAAHLAMRNGYGLVVSERSGETEDPIIADMAVALSAGQIKTGAPVRGERTSKYNALLAIADDLGDTAHYAGPNYRRAF